MTNGRIAAVRDTWWRDVAAFPNLAARFFYGTPPSPDLKPGPDEVFLVCPDEYIRLPHKIKAICRWALDRDFDYLIKCDDDTLLYIDRLMGCGFERVDQMGHFTCRHAPPKNCGCLAVGMCYTLSRRAMSLVAKAAPFAPNPTFPWFAEDYWVSRVLQAEGIRPAGHPGWAVNWVSHYIQFPLPPDTVAAHSVRPDDMRAWYAGRATGPLMSTVGHCGATEI